VKCFPNPLASTLIEAAAIPLTFTNTSIPESTASDKKIYDF